LVRLAFGRELIALGLALGLMLCFVEDVSAGGGGFAPDEDDAGPRFFGFVKDPDNNVIDDAKITVKIKKLNITLIVRTDSQGHFRVRGLDSSLDPADIDISCSKDGYRAAAPPRRLPPTSAGAATEVDCTLEHD
jgi:hypothetical protein